MSERRFTNRYDELVVVTEPTRHLSIAMAASGPASRGAITGTRCYALGHPGAFGPRRTGRKQIRMPPGGFRNGRKLEVISETANLENPRKKHPADTTGHTR